ncbi:MAG: putative efflux rane fusion protein [Myxococcales bacterium]|nr:putative efflux rane fusion protein [Myxococcales bacterium]
MSQLFRQEALEHHAGGGHEGALLDLTPRWTGWTFWLLAGVVIFGVGWAWFGRVYEYASGVAIVRVDGRSDVTAKFAATVASVMVRPGMRVAAGDPLLQFHVDDQTAELDRIQEEFDLQLIKVLRDPVDVPARQALSALRAQRELATARLEQRLVRAPIAGVVSDVRIRSGQHLAVGELLLSVVPENAALSLVALLPGRYRPMLKRDQPLRFELSGYKYEYRETVIDSVAAEIIGPAEAKRFLGPDVADSLDLSEPVVLVQARLPSRHFVAGGAVYDYYDGMHAQAQARVRSEPLLLRAFPAFRELWRHGP